MSRVFALVHWGVGVGSLEHRDSDAVASGVSRRGLECLDVGFAGEDVADGLSERAGAFAVDYADAGEALHEGAVDELRDYRFDHVYTGSSDI